MKALNTHQLVKVPDVVDVSVKNRVVTVKGPRGTLTKSFRHLAVDISMPDPKTVRVEKWFGTRKEQAAVRTVCSHIANLMKGVIKVRSCENPDLFIIVLYKQTTFKRVFNFKDCVFVSPSTCIERLAHSNYR
jgi:hypothetical protein